jgi:hypothetical protein
VFTWQPAEPKSRYEIVIARGNDFGGEVLVKEALEKTSYATRKLGPGYYRWIAYRIVGTERHPLSPEPRKLVIKKSASGIQLPKKLKWE